MKDYPAFCVALAKDGILWTSKNQEKVMNAYLKKHEGQYVRWSFSQVVKQRSHPQNRYYWSIIIGMIAAETGHTPEEVHEFCKAKFLGRTFVKIGESEEEIQKSSATLSTLEFNEYKDRIIAWAGTELKLHIPDPHEMTL